LLASTFLLAGLLAGLAGWIVAAYYGNISFSVGAMLGLKALVAAVVGGIGEWLKVAHMAAAFDVPIAPHYNWDIHTQLVAGIPNGLFIEYFVRMSDPLFG